MKFQVHTSFGKALLLADKGRWEEEEEVWRKRKKNEQKLDIVFVETNTRCLAIVGSVFESMKKVLLIARQIAKKSKPNSFLDVK